ncbi:MAG: hypothetical protein HJJLKODD_01746 [Phycisphaerae bacterium]|nr:hypothetical protein [Phycisphaerae bacterium]
MSIERQLTGDITVLRVDGDLAGINAEELRVLAGEELNAGHRDFLIDLTHTGSADSQGLEALTWLQRECHERLGLVKLLNVSDAFRKILELTRLEQRFTDELEPY